MAVRFRPQNEREKVEEAKLPLGTWKFTVGEDNSLTTLKEGKSGDFHFDHVFKTNASQVIWLSFIIQLTLNN